MRGLGEMLGGDGPLGPRQALRPGPKADGPGYPGFHGPDTHILCFVGIGKTDEAQNGGPPFFHLVWGWREVQKHLNSCHGLCLRGWHGGKHGTGRRSTPGRARRELIAYLLPRRMSTNGLAWWWRNLSIVRTMLRAGLTPSRTTSATAKCGTPIL